MRGEAFSKKLKAMRGIDTISLPPMPGMSLSAQMAAVKEVVECLENRIVLTAKASMVGKTITLSTITHRLGGKLRIPNDHVGAGYPPWLTAVCNWGTRVGTLIDTNRGPIEQADVDNINAHTDAIIAAMIAMWGEVHPGIPVRSLEGNLGFTMDPTHLSTRFQKRVAIARGILSEDGIHTLPGMDTATIQSASESVVSYLEERISEHVREIPSSKTFTLVTARSRNAIYYPSIVDSDAPEWLKAFNVWADQAASAVTDNGAQTKVRVESQTKKFVTAVADMWKKAHGDKGVKVKVTGALDLCFEL